MNIYITIVTMSALFSFSNLSEAQEKPKHEDTEFYTPVPKVIAPGKINSEAHGPSPIKLQSHGDKSEPISFRNIWIREL